MKQVIANYTVIIEKEKRAGTNKVCYTAFVPTLGIATEADTIEKAQREIQSLIQFHVKCLANEGEEIPIETAPALITKSEVILPKDAIIAGA